MEENKKLGTLESMTKEIFLEKPLQAPKAIEEYRSHLTESENEAFVISRKKKIVPRDVVERSRKSIQMETDPKNHDNLQKDFDELKGMVQELANMQKKQAAKSKSKRSNGGTKIVVLPQNTSSNNNNRSSNDSVMDALRKSLM